MHDFYAGSLRKNQAKAQIDDTHLLRYIPQTWQK